jgi:hypothetical protein
MDGSRLVAKRLSRGYGQVDPLHDWAAIAQKSGCRFDDIAGADAIESRSAHQQQASVMAGLHL